MRSPILVYFTLISILFQFEVDSSGNPPSGYTCKINKECLDYLHNELLNKDSQESIYQICKTYQQRIKNCCTNPMNCTESYAKSLTQDLNNNSSILVKQAGSDPLSCESNHLSNLINFLAETQSSICNIGIENCNINCEKELDYLKNKFKECFSIEQPHTIDSVLRQAQNASNNLGCFGEIKKLTKRYKEQSLIQSSFQEDIKPKDIVNCKSIKNSANRQNLNLFASNLCKKAKSQEQNIEKMEEKQKSIKAEESSLQYESPQTLLRESYFASDQVPTSSLEKEALLMESENKSKTMKSNSLDKTNSSPERLQFQADSKTKSENKTNNPFQIETNSKNSDLGTASSKFDPDEVIKKRANLGREENTKSIHTNHISPIESPNRTQEKNTGETNTNTEKRLLSKLVSFFKPKEKSLEEQNEKKFRERNPNFFRRLLSLIPFVNSPKKKELDRFKATQNNPQIISQVVYQSIEAPQIEPIFKQEYQKDPDNPTFKSYDLVKNKPAGVLIKIEHRPDCFEIEDHHECPEGTRHFSVKLQIKDQYITTKCIPIIKTTEREPKIDMGISSLSACSFSTIDFIYDPVIFKFIEIPTELIDPIELDQYIDLNFIIYTGHSYPLAPTLAEINDNVIKELDTKNSNIPIRLNLAEPEKRKIISNKIDLDFLDYKNDHSLGNCKKNINLYSANEFCLNVIEFPILKLGFTRVIGKHNNCSHKENDPNTPNGYSPLSSSKIQKFIHSIEVKSYLPSMFPIAELSSHLLLTLEKKDFISGHCDRTLTRMPYYMTKKFSQLKDRSTRRVPRHGFDSLLNPKEISDGLLMDILEMESERQKKGYSALFAIVPNDYFLFHKLTTDLENREVYGFSLVHPYVETSRYYLSQRKWGFLGSTAFIREDQVDKGTVSHELAHLLGQGKNFYNAKDDPLIKDCRRFQGSDKVSCTNYKVPRALNTHSNEKNQTIWNFITDKYSIMNNQEDIFKLWIDRATHHRVFSTIARIYLAIQENKKKKSLSHSSNAGFTKKTKILLPGFYKKEENAFLSLKPQIYKTDLITPSFKASERNAPPVITFQLKNKKNHVLQEIQRPTHEMNLSLLFKKKGGKVECKENPSGLSYFLVAFDFPKNERAEDLKIFVLDLQGSEIFSAPVRGESR